MQNLVRAIIKEEIIKLLKEEGEIKPLDQSNPTSPPENISQPSSGLNSNDNSVKSPIDSNLSTSTSPATPTPPSPDTQSNEQTGIGDQTMTGTDSSASVGAIGGSGPVTTMSGGGYGGGGGGGSSSLSDTGSSPDPSQSMQNDLSMDSEQDPLSTEDPAEEMKSKALEITEKTKDVQKALKAIKSIIQSHYEDPKEASDFVQTLVDENPQLKPLARRLAFYLLGK